MTFLFQTLFFPSNSLTSPLQQCLPSMGTKYSPSLIRILHLFQSTSYSYSISCFGLPFFLYSLTKTRKGIIRFKSPHIVCTRCIIWLEVQEVRYKHVRMLTLCVSLYWDHYLFGFWNKYKMIFLFNFKKYFLEIFWLT